MFSLPELSTDYFPSFILSPMAVASLLLQSSFHFVYLAMG